MSSYSMKGAQRDPPVPKNGNIQETNDKSPSFDDLNHNEERARFSLNKVLGLLPKDTIHSDEHDDHFAQVGMTAKLFMEPLTRHEMQILGCALYLEKRQKLLTYGDILTLTGRFNQGQAMVITMVYKTLAKLCERRYLEVSDQPSEADGRSRTYKIQQQGKEAFRMAVLNARILSGSKSPVAA